MTDPAPFCGPIAYVTGDYPKVSHTFILREVEALRAMGVSVQTCSIRTPDITEFRGEAEKRAHAETFFVQAAAKNPARLIKDHLALIRRSPKTYLQTLKLAWQTRSPGAKAAAWQLFYFLEAGVLAEHLRQSGVRHLHNHFGNSSCSVTMLASALSGIPFSFTEHGPAIFFEAEKWALDTKIARAAYVVAISHFCRSQLMLFSKPADWSKMSIVHCGVVPDHYGRNSPDRGQKHVVFVGRLDPVKGAPLLVEAFSRVLRDHPDARLTFVGDGPIRAEAQTRVQALGMSDRVTFAGFRSQPEVAEILTTADMLVLPSFAEGVPVVLMEAMASRIPVIASRVAGVQELVEDGQTGYAVPPGDVTTLAQRISNLLSHPDLVRDMGLAGRSVVERDFDITKETAWLREILGGAARGRLRPDDLVE